MSRHRTTDVPRPWLRHYDADVPPTLDYPRLTVPDLLTETARRFPDRPALFYFGARWTYRQLAAAAERCAAALQADGVRPGERVALLLPNCPAFVVALFGALRAGAVVTAVSPLYAVREAAHQLADSGAQTLIALSRFAPLTASVQPQTALRRLVFTALQDDFSPLLRWLYTLTRARRAGDVPAHRASPEGMNLSAFLRGAPAQCQPVSLQPDDLAVLQYTGGTTGTAKGAMLTHANLVSNVCQIRAWAGEFTAGGEVFLGVLPFFHVYGLVAVLLSAVAMGAAVVLLPRFEVRDVRRALRRYHPTYFHGVPTMYVALLTAPGVQRSDFAGLRVCISGAAPLPAEVQQRFEALSGARLVDGYGLTEASPVVAVGPLRGACPPGALGLPLPDTDVRIVDIETGVPDLPPGEVGEIIVRGPQVMKGYWNKPEETAQTLRDGWLFTGDIGALDAEGFLRVVDRKKDKIIASGFDIFPREIEEVLYEHPQVAEAVAVGVPDAYRGETVKVFVVPRPGAVLTAEEVSAFCRERLAAYKVPRVVEFRESLPRTVVGKHLRRALRDER